MGYRYTTDDLLRLRESPLVSKPSKLPPPEQWMGSRAKGEDPANDPTGRRPTLLDTRHTSRISNTIPEDIVLGPPKTAFASATAIRTISGNSSQPLDDENSKNSRINLRDKFFKERDRQDPETERVRDGRSTTLNGKRGLNTESDGWIPVKPRKSFGHEDSERPPRRMSERDGGLNRDPRDRTQKSLDSFGRDRERDGEKEQLPRRNGGREPTIRGRTEASWFRDGDPRQAKENARGRDHVKEGNGDREWRERDRGNEREWTRGGRIEKEPEWMDTPSNEGKKEVHTTEDFEKWKARMKAGSTPADEKPKADVEESFQEVAATSKQSKKVEAPLLMEPGIDKFFGLWNESGAKPNEMKTEPASLQKHPVSKVAAGKASRFTSFFSPAEEVSRQLADAPTPAAIPPGPDQNASTEDKEGFQRILQMLGGTTIGQEAPAQDVGRTGTTKQRAPKEHDISQLFIGNTGPHNPNLDLRAGPPAEDRSRSLPGFDDPFAARPHQAGGPDRNNEFLYSLMQSSQGNTERGGPIAPMFPMDDMSQRAQVLQSGWQRDAPENPDPRVISGLPPGLIEDPAMINSQRRRPENAHPLQPSVNRQQPPRPPGFDQVPPGWPGHQNQPPTQRHVLPPPGLNDAGRGGQFPAFGPPPPGMPFPVSDPRAAMGPNGRGMMPNLPPPGFFGMNGPPPPGYPPMPFHEGMMGLPGGGDPRVRPGVPPFDPFADAGTVARGRGAPPGL